MQRVVYSRALCGWLLCSLAAGCALSLDADLVRPDLDGSAACSRDAACARREDAESERDSEREQDADAPGPSDDDSVTDGAGVDSGSAPTDLGDGDVHDAGSAPLDSGSTWISTIDAGDGGSGLDADLDAGAESPEVDSGGCIGDESCAHVDGFCRADYSCGARCLAPRGCAILGTRGAEVASMLTAEGALLWGTSAGKDSFGNWLHDGSIYRLHQDGTSTSLVNGQDFVLIERVIDGQIYFRGDYGENMKRAPLAGGYASALNWSNGPVRTVIESPGFLWWTRPGTFNAGKPELELWRRARGSEGPDQKLKTLPGYRLLAASDSAVIYSTQLDNTTSLDGHVMLDDLSGAAPRLVFTSSSSFVSKVWTEGQNLISVVNATLGEVHHAPLSGGNDTLLAPSGWAAEAVINAPWAVWAVVTGFEPDPVVLNFGRTRLDGGGQRTLIQIHWEGRQSNTIPFALTPWGNEIVYYDMLQQRLFRVELPAFPCSGSLACPAGQTCQSDQTCR